MKTYLHAFIMCQSMFCAIPAPQVWDEKAKDLAGRFIKNFNKYTTNEAGKALVAAGPKL